MANVSVASRLVAFFLSSFFSLRLPLFLDLDERYFPAIRFEVFLDGGKKGRKGKREK